MGPQVKLLLKMIFQKIQLCPPPLHAIRKEIIIPCSINSPASKLREQSLNFQEEFIYITQEESLRSVFHTHKFE